MDEWLAKIGMPSAVVPSPTLDEAGADFLTLSWSWPDAPRGLYEFELRWRPARAPASEVQAQRFGGGTSFTHTLRGLGPGAHHLAVHAVAISGVSAAEKRSSELIAHTGAASGERAYSYPELRDIAPSCSMDCPKPMHVQSAANATTAGHGGVHVARQIFSCSLV